jgi:hypothetical protein
VPSSQVSLAATLEATLTNNAPIEFDISAKIGESTGVSFQGDLEGTWNQAFGLSWLSFKNVEASIAFKSGAIQTFDIDGDIQVQFLDADSTSVTINLQGPTFQDWSVEVEVFVSNVQALLQGVGLTAPALTAEISMMTSLILTSYAAGGNKAGLTLSGSALVQGGGALATDVS